MGQLTFKQNSSLDWQTYTAPFFSTLSDELALYQFYFILSLFYSFFIFRLFSVYMFDFVVNSSQNRCYIVLHATRLNDLMSCKGTAFWMASEVESKKFGIGVID